MSEEPESDLLGFEFDSSTATATATGDGVSFCLAELEVVNWGPFEGRHRCLIHPEGTAIIGPTGSGKTTLVDALMTLLAPFPKYNLASTGGHESDRDLISYVRGVSGVESAETENSHIARPGSAVTGLAGHYQSINGSDTVSIGVLLSIDGSGNAAADLKKTWFFARNIGNVLETLLLQHQEGGKAALTRHARETVGLRLFASKKEYLAQVRSFFEVGENAFSLLNRAAGLKQINSIDQIFRELVLDDRSAFDRAAEVANEFDSLHGIYEELQTARRQRDSLLPVRQGWHNWEKISAKLATLRHLKELLPVRFAEAAMHLWEREKGRLTLALDKTTSALGDATARAEALENRERTLNEEYLRHGGAAIQSIEEIIQTKVQRSGEVRKNAGVYEAFAAALGLETKTDETSFQRNREQLPELRGAADAAHAFARQGAVDLAATLKQHRATERNLLLEIRQVEERPHSNIPAPFQTFREALAQELDMAGEDLPFVAELVEVRAGERPWQGAIERAIGPERLRILVPVHRMDEALAWINRRDNRLHVRLQSADSSPGPAHFFEDGFTRKLDYRDHPLREQVKVLLARRDRHCVDSIETLRHTEHAMTLDGTMSDREGRFEKQDQRPLAVDWMTGFDNRHLLAALQGNWQLAREEIGRLDEESQIHSRAERECSEKITIIAQLESVDFSQIDLVGVEREIEQQRQRLIDLIRPDSDAATAKARHDEVLGELKITREEISTLTEQLGSSKSELAAATRELGLVVERKGGGLTKEDTILAEKEFPLSDDIQIRQLDETERSARQRIETKIQESEDRKSDIERSLIRSMEGALRVDTGVLAETGTELRDVPAHLDRLAVLEREALPEKRQRFLDYLNLSSGQGVTQLFAQIENEVTMVEERVADLNSTLSRVDFRESRYLQLKPQRIVHESLRQIEAAHRKLRLDALHAKDDEGEAHYRALGEVIRLLRGASEKRHTLGAQAMLDPRHRLQFFVVEVDRETGRVSGQRSGSQTGSGGEKEMMASYILTASLSYALCPAGAARPKYATIVLDEAFSKSSPAAAARIIKALRAFGLHPLFVTPNKEIALLKAHTRSAVLVHNKNQRATLASLTWEEIGDHSRRRMAPEFKDHCTEEMRGVEKGEVVLQVTRHGKTIAEVCKPEEEPDAPFLGAGKGTVTLNPSYDPHAPAFDEEDWEMNR